MKSLNQELLKRFPGGTLFDAATRNRAPDPDYDYTRSIRYQHFEFPIEFHRPRFGTEGFHIRHRLCHLINS